MKRSARSTALDALLQMEKNEGYSNLVIDKALKAAQLDRRDAAPAAEAFTVCWKSSLPWIIF